MRFVAKNTPFPATIVLNSPFTRAWDRNWLRMDFVRQWLWGLAGYTDILTF